MVAMQGHTAIAVGGAGKARIGEFLREHIWGIRPAPRCAQDRDRNGREPLSFEQALMRGRMIGLDEGLMVLVQCSRRASQRELLVIEPPLNLNMRFHPVQVAFPLRTHDRHRLDLEPPADRFKRVRGIGPATIRHEGLWGRCQLIRVDLVWREERDERGAAADGCCP
jgi:hypothetical protein